MKKLFGSLLFLFIIYYLIQFLFIYISKGYQKSYNVITDNIKFDITEKYSANRKNETDNYHFNIKVNDTDYSLQTYHNFNKKNKIIKDIYHFKNTQYECIFPVFIDDITPFDMVCKHDNYYINYSAINNKEESMITFVSNLKNYNKNQYINNLDNMSFKDYITLYEKNIVSKHYIGISSYKGIYSISNNITVYNTFETDIYKRPISIYVDNYYVTADYNSLSYFNKFYMTNLLNGEVTTIITNHNISFDSYIMGTFKNSFYLLDKENKKQYEVDLETKKVLEVGNVDTQVKLYNINKWEKLNINDVIKKNIKFNPFIYENDIIIYKTQKKYSGFNYYYKLNNGKYDVYRSSIQDIDKKIYLFTTSDYLNIFFIDDYVYYKEGNYLYYYNDNTGIRTLIKNTEFEFNDSIIINGYSKK